MVVIKKTNILRIVALFILGLLAVVVIWWLVKNKQAPSTPSSFNKSIEKTSTQPSVELSNPEVSVSSDTAPAPAEGDLDFSSSLDSLYDKYPWYGKMPIDTSQYTIVWDFNRSQFRIRLKISSSSAQATKDAFLSNAIANLKNVVGEDTLTYQYYVLYLD